MSCNLTRFYLCESDISLKDFLKRDLKYHVACVDIETIEADEYEKKLKQEDADYLRVDL